MSMPSAPARVVARRADVAREIRRAAPLMARLRAPVTARAPWLTAVLNVQAGSRPLAVVVDGADDDGPDAAAFLAVRRFEVTLLGQDAAPLPPGRPAARLLARDPRAAQALADGICALLGRTRSLRLEGLPLGDPTARALTARLPDGRIANERSTRLLDDLDSVGPVVRSRDPRDLEQQLPRLLERLDERGARELLRPSARLHAAIGELEVAVVPDREHPRAVLLTLLDGEDRWPWWGWTSAGGLGSEMGTPVVGVSAPARRWPRRRLTRRPC
jgi:hypothetical protein